MLREKRKQSYWRVMILNCVAADILLFVGSLSPGHVGEAPASNQARFSAYCSRFDRIAARAQNFNLSQSKARRTRTDLAPATPGVWSGLIHIDGRPAPAAFSPSAYCSLHTSHPSNRAPPSTAT